MMRFWSIRGLSSDLINEVMEFPETVWNSSMPIRVDKDTEIPFEKDWVMERFPFSSWDKR